MSANSEKNPTYYRCTVCGEIFTRPDPCHAYHSMTQDKKSSPEGSVAIILTGNYGTCGMCYECWQLGPPDHA